MTTDSSAQKPRYQGIFLFYGLYMAVALVTRIILLIKAHAVVDVDLSLVGAFFSGFFFDFCVASMMSIPWVLYLTFVPQRIFEHRFHRWMVYGGFFIAAYLFSFGIVSEWVFWDEFGVRFNFIAVDYLVYTTEVIRNIRESYDLGMIFAGVFVIALIFFTVLWKTDLLLHFTQSNSRFRNRWKPALVFLAIPLLLGVGVQERFLPEFANNYNRELGKNGLFSLFAAFWYNQLDFDKFYPTEEEPQSFADLRGLLAEANSHFESSADNPITRYIDNGADEKRWNVIQITVESLSGEYLKAWGNSDGLTPYLDRLAEESLFLRNFYATGTRTVRGMEALSLSVPPTPGRSILKRPHNEGLFTIGTPFRDRGYDLSFLYGGNGFFDNMDYFFAHNGFRIVDKPSVDKDKITFENAWGACDEDLLGWSLEEADRCFKEEKPFYQFIMTTSNHRPYTYPEGRVSIPSGTGREGAVQYTDYAIGEFIRKASAKPWFKNTVFVIVADHCAGSARKQELPVRKYEIPLILYAPGLITPAVEERLCSQIDFAPTLFGLMGWSYESKFYGRDVLKMRPSDGRALISNYQKLGLLRENQLSVIKPVKALSVYQCDRGTGELTETQQALPQTKAEVLAYYQTASHLFSQGRLADLR